MTYKGGMILFPEIFVLRDTGVHICTVNSSNVTSNIEAHIDQHFSI